VKAGNHLEKNGPACEDLLASLTHQGARCTRSAPGYGLFGCLAQ
jgi:hypothetical protein